jgi:hypothetical protein
VDTKNHQRIKEETLKVEGCLLLELFQLFFSLSFLSLELVHRMRDYALKVKLLKERLALNAMILIALIARAVLKFAQYVKRIIFYF